MIRSLDYHIAVEVRCLDPISLVGAGIGLLGGLFASKGSSATPTVTPTPAAPAPATSPTGDASTNKAPSAPSFLSSAAAASAGNTTGQKTLLGA